MRWERQRVEHRWTLYNICFIRTILAAVLYTDHLEAIIIIQSRDNDALNENESSGRGKKCPNMHIF